MKKIASLWIVVFCIFSFYSVYAEQPDDAAILSAEEEEAAKMLVPPQSAIVMEKESGRILYEINPRQKLPMASTTKIMTAIVALEKGNPADNVTISAAAEGVEGSSMYIRQGEIMSLEELLYGLMLCSGNDAAVAIAEHVGGNIEQFVQMMNQKAQEIGALDTHFDNPNGLPSDSHYSTAYDMALITAYGLKNATFAKIVSTREMTISGYGKQYVRQLVNHNKLLKMYPDCIGVKTGFTKEAGRCLVSAAKRDGMTLICVTLNAPNDWDNHMSFYDECFQKFHLQAIEIPKDQNTTFSIKGGAVRESTAVLSHQTAFPLTEGETIDTKVEFQKDIQAPVMAGTVVGKLKILVNGSETGGMELIANEEIPVGNFAFENISKTLLAEIEDVYQFWLSLFGNKFVK